MRSWTGALRALALALVIPNGLLLAQSDLSGDALGRGPFGHMKALLERTIFKVDVLTLDLCLDEPTSQALARAAGGGGEPERQKVADLAVEADRALAVIGFHRDVSMDQFLGGIGDDHERAVEAGLLADSTRRALARDLPTWYAFLEERGVKKGDRIAYRFEPGSVRVTYVGVDGRTYLDRTSLGPERRASILGAYFAPGASLRERLLDSVLAGEAVREGEAGREGEARCMALLDEWGGGRP